MANFAAKTNENAFSAAAAASFVCASPLLLSVLGILPGIIIVAIILAITSALHICEGHRFGVIRRA